MKRLVTIVILAVLLVALVFVIRFAYIIITDRSQFWVEAPLLVSSIAAIIASICAWLASRSLKMTEEALELTRITMRPFLALQAGDMSAKQIKEKVILEFHVKNTGSVPANVFTMGMRFFDDAELIEEDNTSKYYPERKEEPKDVVIFPGASYNLERWFDLSHSVGKKLYEDIVSGKVKLRFRATYGAQGIEYLTVQTEKLSKAVAGQMTRLPIQPQRWT